MYMHVQCILCYPNTSSFMKICIPHDVQLYSIRAMPKWEYQVFSTFRYIMQKTLQEAGIPAYVILDAAVGWAATHRLLSSISGKLFAVSISYIMERIDLVIFGAEGVVESGGIINKVWHIETDLYYSLFSKCGPTPPLPLLATHDISRSKGTRMSVINGSHWESSKWIRSGRLWNLGYSLTVVYHCVYGEGLLFVNRL